MIVLIFKTLYLKRDMSDSQQHPLHIYQIYNVRTVGNQTWHFLNRGSLEIMSTVPEQISGLNLA